MKKPLLPTILVATNVFIPGNTALEALRWEASLAALSGDFHLVAESRGPDCGYDLATADGRHVLELKLSLQSVRDLSAALIRLASLLGRDVHPTRATLVACLPKMTVQRVREEWERARGLLRPEIATRLGLVALAADGDACIPGDAELRRLAALARTALREQASPTTVERAAGPWSPRQFEVWMVLLEAWLRGERPLAIKDVLRRSGTSTATVKATFDRLSSRGELERTSGRRASFARFPRRSLGEILSLADGLRHTVRFVDASGRPPDPRGLLRRLEAKAPPRVGLGGVEAARRYTPEFDLEGLPRVDLSVHGQEPLAWLGAVEPALRRAREDEPSPVLVVHRVLRAEPGFEVAAGPSSGPLPIAGRAEALLDLYELRLTAQADDFVHALRREAGT